MFDRILLLTEGRIAFLGPINEALSFFASQGMPCPVNYNPADFYIFSLALIPGREVESKKKIQEICDRYEASEHRRRVEVILREQDHQTQSSYHQTEGMVMQMNNDNNKFNLSPYRVEWLAQFRAVFWRSWVTIMRDPRILVAKIGAAIVIYTYLICFQ